MKEQTLRETVQKVDARLERVEQILPTLATKMELQASIQSAAEETRRYFDVVSEATRYEIRMLADGQQAVADGQRALTERLDRSIEEIKGVLAARRLHVAISVWHNSMA